MWTKHTRDVFNNASARSTLDCLLAKVLRGDFEVFMSRNTWMLNRQWFWFKASQKMGPRLRVSSNRLGEAGNRTCHPWFTRHRFISYTTAASLCTQYFHIRLSEWRFMFLCVDIWMEQFKLKVGRSFTLNLFPTNGGFDLFVTGRSHSFIERALAIIQQCNDHKDKLSLSRALTSLNSPHACKEAVI